MARIPDKVIDQLKTDISLVLLVERYGIELKKQGKDLAGLCPFHDDKEPSLIVSESKNVFHCFGCNASGTPIDWVMQIERIGFREAVERLQQNTFPLTAVPTATPKPPAKPEPISRTPEQQAMLNRAADYYHRVLKDSPSALKYLDKRGLNHPELIDTFKLGYADNTLTKKVPNRDCKTGREQRDLLHAVGLVRDNGHEHLTGCLVIPVLNTQGEVLDLYGRRVIDRARTENVPSHYYLPGPHRGVFNLDTFRNSNEIILCEAFIDALTFWCNGFKNVTASFGVNGFTDAMLNALKAQAINTVYIAYDRDKAGDAAAIELAKKLESEHIGCYRVNVPKGMDVNEYALHGRSSAARGQESGAVANKVKPAEKSLKVVIDNAQWMHAHEPPLKDRALHELREIQKTLEKNPEAGIQNTEEKNSSAELPSDALPGNTIDVKDHEILITLQDRQYRIRGLNKNLSYDQLKLNVRVVKGDALHVDTFDFYAARPRQQFIQQAAKELRVDEEMIKRDLGRVLLQLEDLQDRQIKNTLDVKPKTVELSAAETDEALSLLKSSDLLNTIVTDFERCGVVGERTNTLMGYLCCVSRKLDKPLAVLIQSTSAAGKSSLLDAVLNMMPAEDAIQYSAMTGQSLYYMSGRDLKHKILAVAEEEGASQASYALKLLQSEGELTIASTGKDPATGNLETQEYHVEGPVMLCMTTTAIDIDEELLNRCLVLTVNEDRTQTQAIHQRQREQRTLEGLLAKQDKTAIIQQHQNAQRLLKPLPVVNPHAKQLTFLDDQTRTRRDHEKYLTLIESIALLHQYQREIKTVTHQDKVIEYIDVTLDDIAIANQLAHEVLGRTLDELPPQTRRLLSLLCDMVRKDIKQHSIEQKDYRFSRKDVRAFTGWTDFQVRTHINRLVELEYVLAHTGKRGQHFIYELLFDGDGDHQPHLNGLIDIKQLQQDCGEKNEGLKPNNEGSSSPQRAAIEPLTSRAIKRKKTNAHNTLAAISVESPPNAVLTDKTVALTQAG